MINGDTVVKQYLPQPLVLPEHLRHVFLIQLGVFLLVKYLPRHLKVFLNCPGIPHSATTNGGMTNIGPESNKVDTDSPK